MTTADAHHDDDLEVLERTLDCFDPAERRAALEQLVSRLDSGELSVAPPREAVNLHVHTFYSYNACGYSPTGFAWRARRAGLAAGGIVDFDVLDGVEEFLKAARRVGLRACAGIETRVFIEAFADRVINSPGEPGIAYYMGTGFIQSRCATEQSEFLARLQRIATERNQAILERVNAVLAPVTLDYRRDVQRLTPRGNATERHICAAYARKAREHFPEDRELAAFWSEKLGLDAARLDLPEGPRLQNQIRARMMKRGGVGYVPPDRGSFPKLEDMNRFVLSAGAIPTVAWLDGTSEGEQALVEWLDTAARTGATALAIIPARNYTPGKPDLKLQKLQEVVAEAERRHWPIFVGTEMNSPGNPFVDDFDCAELAPFRRIFMKGAYIAFAHTVLQAAAGLGYVSEWAQRYLPDLAERMAYYETVGRALDPHQSPAALRWHPAMTPDEVLQRVGGA